MSAAAWKQSASAALVSMLGLVGSPTALAQAYPTKPIRLLLGYAPGGPSDLTARLLGPYINEALGQPLVVDNRPGAGGSLAAALLANAEPDGHTLLLAANGEIAIAPNL